MKKIIVLLVIGFMPFISFAQDDTWIEVTKNKHKNPIYMKSTLTNIDEYGIQVWLKQDLPSFKTTKGVVYKNVHMKTLYSYNCIKIKMQVRSVVMYSSKGEIISSYNRPEYENSFDYEDVVPETVAEALLNKACELFNN